MDYVVLLSLCLDLILTSYISVPLGKLDLQSQGKTQITDLTSKHIQILNEY